MRHASLVFGMSLAVTVFAGCGSDADQPEKPAAGGLAIVDLDEVARRIGRDLEMKKHARRRQQSLLADLLDMRETLRLQVSEKEDEIGNNAIDEDIGENKQLQELQGRLNRQYTREQVRARGDLQRFSQELIEQFREDIKPVLQEVAAERGLSVVIPKNDALILTFEPTVDITDAVVKRLQAEQDREPAKIAAETDTTSVN